MKKKTGTLSKSLGDGVVPEDGTTLEVRWRRFCLTEGKV